MKQLTNREKKAILHRVGITFRALGMCPEISLNYVLVTGEWEACSAKVMSQFEGIYKYRRDTGDFRFCNPNTKIGNKLRRAVVAAEIDRLHKLIKEEEREL